MFYFKKNCIFAPLKITVLNLVNLLKIKIIIFLPYTIKTEFYDKFYIKTQKYRYSCSY
ncbi:MAG: hypothetical protein H6Q25_1455 [Bacteroidetes bacterium]|nr:hypothetical protein [Bacteroidota bacterium]